MSRLEASESVRTIVALRARDSFGRLVATGVVTWLSLQAIVNIGVNTGTLPTKGLTLPLLSFGGSAIAATCCSIAVLLRVDWENRQIMRGHTV